MRSARAEEDDEVPRAEMMTSDRLTNRKARQVTAQSISVHGIVSTTTTKNMGAGGNRKC